VSRRPGVRCAAVLLALLDGVVPEGRRTAALCSLRVCAIVVAAVPSIRRCTVARRVVCRAHVGGAELEVGAVQPATIDGIVPPIGVVAVGGVVAAGHAADVPVVVLVTLAARVGVVQGVGH
jgi:hypothetical protein